MITSKMDTLWSWDAYRVRSAARGDHAYRAYCKHHCATKADSSASLQVNVQTRLIEVWNAKLIPTTCQAP